MGQNAPELPAQPSSLAAVEAPPAAGRSRKVMYGIAVCDAARAEFDLLDGAIEALPADADGTGSPSQPHGQDLALRERSGLIRCGAFTRPAGPPYHSQA